MKYSFIVPVFNRPDEVRELLESMTQQTLKDFEVIIVEDGSKEPCKEVCNDFADRLDIHYHWKENSGPGQSRNYGAERASGEWLIVLDSDVVLPEGYLTAVGSTLSHQPSAIDAWGGVNAFFNFASADNDLIAKLFKHSFTQGLYEGAQG
jgi:glycosyltransferase involved in cell wall biosynthesis